MESQLLRDLQGNDLGNDDYGVSQVAAERGMLNDLVQDTMMQKDVLLKNLLLRRQGKAYVGEASGQPEDLVPRLVLDDWLAKRQEVMYEGVAFGQGG